MRSNQHFVKTLPASHNHASRQAHARLSAELKEALLLLQDNEAIGKRATEPSPGQGEPALLQQCLELLQAQNDLAIEPIRTVHHFACTGGTLVSKCLAATPNTQLLSEVDPFSEIAPAAQSGAFVPTDMIGLLRQSSRGHDDESVAEIFRAEIRALYRSCTAKGLRLILRDHAHSRYCVGDKVASHLRLCLLLPQELPVTGIVTVRHPLDSWMSLQKNNWVHFKPATIEEYCQRYSSFLDDHFAFPVHRYEDLTKQPATAVKRIAENLGLPFVDNFEEVFSIFKISGDSGRFGNTIAPRPRRDVCAGLKEEANNSGAYIKLCERLGYEPKT